MAIPIVKIMTPIPTNETRLFKNDVDRNTLQTNGKVNNEYMLQTAAKVAKVRPNS